MIVYCYTILVKRYSDFWESEGGGVSLRGAKYINTLKSGCSDCRNGFGPIGVDDESLASGCAIADILNCIILYAGGGIVRLADVRELCKYDQKWHLFVSIFFHSPYTHTLLPVFLNMLPFSLLFLLFLFSYNLLISFSFYLSFFTHWALNPINSQS